MLEDVENAAGNRLFEDEEGTFGFTGLLSSRPTRHQDSRRAKKPGSLMRAMWRDAEHESIARNDPAVVAQATVQTTHRIVREMCRLVGWISTNDGLRSIDLTTARNIAAPSMDMMNTDAGTASIVVKLSKAGHRLSPLPRRNQSIESLREYMDLFASVASSLGVIESVDGQIALSRIVMIPPPWACWPTPGQIAAYEAALIDGVVDSIVARGAIRTEKWLRMHTLFQHHEIRSMVAMARIESVEKTSSSIKEDQAVITLRLEDLVMRCRKSGDLRAELQAVKALAIVRGVTRVTPEDEEADFLRLARRVANMAALPVDAMEHHPQVLPPAAQLPELPS